MHYKDTSSSLGQNRRAIAKGTFQIMKHGQDVKILNGQMLVNWLVVFYVPSNSEVI